jgi:CheY-like chemotaxis protein
MLITLGELQNRARGRAISELTKRDWAEAGERHQRHRFEVTLASIGDGVIATDAEGRITFINRVASELSEWKEDALGRPVGEVFVVKHEDEPRGCWHDRLCFSARKCLKRMSQRPSPAELQNDPAMDQTILVNDDEEIVRSTADSALRRLGYNVVTVPDGAEGVKAIASLQESIALVLLDLSMPGMSSSGETLDQIRKISQDVPVVLSSGYGEADVLRRFENQKVAGFLQKPYTGRTLASRVREAIGRRERQQWRDPTAGEVTREER